MRFYGIQPSEMDAIDNDQAESLLECIDIITATEMLQSMRVIDFPTMKADARRSLHRDLKKQATPNIIKPEARAITTKDLASILNRGK